MSKFDPMEYAIKIKGQRGALVDYLPATAKLKWLLTEFPDAKILSSAERLTDDVAVIKAHIILPNGAEAQAFGAVKEANFAANVEKADTRAVARACTKLGFDINGAQDFLDDEDVVETSETPLAVEVNDIDKFPGKWDDFKIEDFDYLKNPIATDEELADLLRDTMRAAGFSPLGFLKHEYFSELAYTESKKLPNPPKRRLLTDVPAALSEEVMEWLVQLPQIAMKK